MLLTGERKKSSVLNRSGVKKKKRVTSMKSEKIENTEGKKRA